MLWHSFLKSWDIPMQAWNTKILLISVRYFDWTTEESILYREKVKKFDISISNIIRDLISLGWPQWLLGGLKIYTIFSCILVHGSITQNFDCWEDYLHFFKFSFILPCKLMWMILPPFLLIPIPIELEKFAYYYGTCDVSCRSFILIQYDLCDIVFKIELCMNNLYCYSCDMTISFEQNIGSI